MTNPTCLQFPQLQASIDVWHKMMAYIVNCPTEVNGFGIIDQISTDLFVLRDVFITKQIAGPAHVEVEPQVLSDLMTDMLARGQNPGSIKFQWHSHVNMDAYFSMTDLDNIERWAGDWLISLVANKRGEYSCRLDIFKGVRVGIELRPALVSVIDPDVMVQTAAEIHQKVSRPAGMLQRERPVSSGRPVPQRAIQLGNPEENALVTPSRP